jgi:hypothetical protein
MIIYLYSSWERFLIVLLAIIAIWFVQARRGRQPQGLDQAQANV